jgi:hypothetical protein
MAEIDKLLDHHACAKIADTLHGRGLPNGQGRQVQDLAPRGARD